VSSDRQLSLVGIHGSELGVHGNELSTGTYCTRSHQLANTGRYCEWNESFWRRHPASIVCWYFSASQNFNANGLVWT